MGIDAPSQEVLLHSNPLTVPPPRRKFVKPSETKETMLPIFIVVGITFPLLTAIGYIADVDSTFVLLRGPIGLLLGGFGLLMLGAAVFTFLQLKNEAAQKAQQQP